MDIKVIELTESIESEFLGSGTRAEALAEETLGIPGRMVSGSKSGFCASHPDSEPVFNANVCTKEDGKIWYGDLELGADGTRLQALADALGRVVHVLREMDARFENEGRHSSRGPSRSSAPRRLSPSTRRCRRRTGGRMTVLAIATCLLALVFLLAPLPGAGA